MLKKIYYIILKLLKLPIFYRAVLIILMVQALTAASYSNPILNINPEEHAVYDIFEGSGPSMGYSTTMKPIYTFKSALLVNKAHLIRQNLNVGDDTGYYLKPLNSLSFMFYYTDDDNFYFEGKSGFKLQKGINFFLFEDGYLSLGKHFAIYYQFKQTFREDKQEFEFYRAYGKLNFWKLSIEGGIDNVNLGPGENGLVLSNNASTYPMVKIQTEEHIQLLGKWDFLFMNGWLIEDRGEYDNPMIMAFRTVWKPFDYIELGVTRSVIHGGDGRQAPEWYEYFDLWISSKARGATSPERFDYDALGGYDISIYLPFHLLKEELEITKLYFHVAGSNLIEPWQYSDKRAFQYGLFMSFYNNFIRIEYVETARNMYTQRNYSSEDYAFKELSLGYPYGSDIQTVQVKHRFYVLDFLSFEYRFGWLLQPVSQSNNSNRYFFSILADVRVWNFAIEAYFRYDMAENYDANPLPTKYNILSGNRELITAGFAVRWKI